MKQPGLLLSAVLLASSVSVFVQVCQASTPDCDGSPRIVGAFGAEDRTASSVAVPAGVRDQLPEVHIVRRVLDAGLSPSGEQVIVYDSAVDASDPHPKLAFVVHGRLVKLFDASDLAPRGGGFERYLSSCQFALATNQRAMVFAFSTAFDGTGSAFAIIGWQSGEYHVVFNPLVSQGRMELGTAKITLWKRSVEGTH